MNQRREPRFEIDQPVEITVFGPPELHLPGVIRNASGRGIGVEVSGPLATGSALKISMEDTLLLGEVIYSRPENGNWYLGVQLEHALCGLAELAATLREFTEEYLGTGDYNAVHQGRHKMDR
jgi:hypothetical protein